jgi:hypothetical protein
MMLEVYVPIMQMLHAGSTMSYSIVRHIDNQLTFNDSRWVGASQQALAIQKVLATPKVTNDIKASKSMEAKYGNISTDISPSSSPSPTVTAAFDDAASLLMVADYVISNGVIPPRKAIPMVCNPPSIISLNGFTSQNGGGGDMTICFSR